MRNRKRAVGSDTKLFIGKGNVGSKRRERARRQKIARIVLLVLCICLIAGTAACVNHFSKKAKEAKAKAAYELKIKKEKEAKKKAEEKKKAELKKNLESIKPPEVKDKEKAEGVPISVLDPATQESLDKAFEGTLIIGDSRTEGLKFFSGIKTAKFFSTKSLTVNRIVEGKQVAVDGAMLSIYDVLGQANYSKVIVCSGLNEVGWGSAERFAQSYGQLVDAIRQSQPNAEIYLQAILPVSQAKNDSQKVFTNANILWYNESIVNLASEKGVKFINPSSPLIDGTGALLPDASSDGIHLSAAYCKIWGHSLGNIISPGVLVKEQPPEPQATENE